MPNLSAAHKPMAERLAPPGGWYAVYVKSRHEARVENRLLNQNFDVFLPRQKQPSRRRNRALIIQVPLFPGYLFVRAGLSPERYLQILRTPGVVRVLCHQGAPALVPEREIESLRSLCRLNLAMKHHPYRPGQKVEVLRGCLAGVVGKVSRARPGRTRVLVSVELLRRSVTVEIEAADLLAS